MGSETRKTSTYVPDPYGIEVGNPLKVPACYEEKWMFNVHAIDTGGAVDAIGCNECRCNLYNVTVDKDGRPLRPNYVGGLYCCYDGTQCKVKNGVRNFEYDVKKSTAGVATNNYSSSRRSSVSFPTAGDVIYGFAQQYIGGTGASLYGEDGRAICSSKPIYGKGNDVGDEAGYIVGMSTCYPKPGSVKIAKGETVTLESNYSSKKMHTGVLGLFYILVAESSI
ncbi:hypothetical protein E3N88_21236 [Mikania micrantha]|uniref:Uncharacterized protein n=1 Tax=Mikania micrantha TaxID=192012 RepID=A0A5N6NL46_9ASTR|nr:hypothetical protein E3N88_21236 [Mikania micrantha]